MDDIKQKVNGNMEQYDQIKGILFRIAKQEEAAQAPGNYIGYQGAGWDDDYGYDDYQWDSWDYDADWQDDDWHDEDTAGTDSSTWEHVSATEESSPSDHNVYKGKGT